MDPEDPRIRAVLTRLLAESAVFTGLWSENDARGKQAAIKRFALPDVGSITLQSQTFDVRSAPGQELAIQHAERAPRPGTHCACPGPGPPPGAPRRRSATARTPPYPSSTHPS
jgi:transcription regulator MmyB-like protein